MTWGTWARASCPVLERTAVGRAGGSTRRYHRPRHSRAARGRWRRGTQLAARKQPGATGCWQGHSSRVACPFATGRRWRMGRSQGQGPAQGQQWADRVWVAALLATKQLCLGGGRRRCWGHPQRRWMQGGAGGLNSSAEAAPSMLPTTMPRQPFRRVGSSPQLAVRPLSQRVGMGLHSVDRVQRKVATANAQAMRSAT